MPWTLALEFLLLEGNKDQISLVGGPGTNPSNFALPLSLEELFSLRKRGKTYSIAYCVCLVL